MADYFDLSERDFLGVGEGSASGPGLSKSRAAGAESEKKWRVAEMQATAQLNPVFPYRRGGFEPDFWF